MPNGKLVEFIRDHSEWRMKMDFMGFLISKFSVVPPWLRNISYLVVLFLMAYLVLAPRVITGQVVALTDKGGWVAYPGTDIQTHVQGHVMRFMTNESGRWSIPVFNRLPGSTMLQVYHQDEHAWYDVKVKFLDLWRADFRIVIARKQPLVRLELVSRTPSIPGFGTMFAAMREWIVPSATAGALVKRRKIRPKKEKKIKFRGGIRGKGAGVKSTTQGEKSRAPKNVPAASQPVSVDKIAAVISDEDLQSIKISISKVVEIPPSEITLSSPFSGADGLSYLNRIQVIESLERTHNLKIPDRHWKQIETVGELAGYLADRRKLEEIFPEIKKIDSKADWFRIQRAIPKEERPYFAPIKR